MFPGQGKQAKEFFYGGYVGELVGDKKHGKGIVRYKNGTVYDGQWVNDLGHGHGVFRWQEGQVMKGSLSVGKWVENPPACTSHLTGRSAMPREYLLLLILPLALVGTEFFIDFYDENQNTLRQLLMAISTMYHF